VNTSHIVRLFNVKKRADVKTKGTSRKTKIKPRPWRLRWTVAGQGFSKSFETETAGLSFRSELQKARNDGEPFEVTTGLPVSMYREEEDRKQAAEDAQKQETSWYDFAVTYIDHMWKDASAMHRKNLAEVMMWATTAMLTDEPTSFSGPELRRALKVWAFNSNHRDLAPQDAKEHIAWVSCHVRPLTSVSTTAAAAEVLTAMQKKLNGEPRGKHCKRRARTIFRHALEYAVELGHLDVNPAVGIKRERVKFSEAIDKRRVANPKQVRALLAKVAEDQPNGWRYHGFFSVMYHAGLRPEEAVNLRVQDLELPSGEGWGTLHLSKAAPHAGSMWTNSGKSRDTRGLKQREPGDTRPVPCSPELTRILKGYMAHEKFEPGPDGLLFTGSRSEQLADSTIRKVWARSRSEVMTAEEVASPLARRPYDLRHACVSTWLSVGVPVTTVSEWAGHSVAVLLRIYAKCLVGQDEAARRRIEDELS